MKYTISEIKQLIKNAKYNLQANINWRKDSLEIALASGDEKRIAKAERNLKFAKNYNWRADVRFDIQLGKSNNTYKKQRPNPANYNGFCGYLDDLDIYRTQN